MIRSDDQKGARPTAKIVPLFPANDHMRPPFDNRRTGPGPSAAALSAAFWRGWADYKDYLGQLALRWMSGNRADAEDILSRACIKAHDRYLRDAARIRNLRSWLAR